MPIKKFCDIDIMYIKNLVNEETGHILETRDFCQFNNLDKNWWLVHQGIIAAIPEKWRKLLKEDDYRDMPERLHVTDVTGAKKPSQVIYKFIGRNKNMSKCFKYAEKWSKTLSLSYTDLDEYLLNFKNLYKITDEVKMRNFQYRLLLGKVFTNTILNKWGKVPSPNCEQCGKDKIQDIKHLLWDCELSKKLWEYLQNTGKNPEWVWSFIAIMTNKVYGTVNSGINKIVLFTKYFIFQHKCLQEKFTTNKWLHFLKAQFEVEREIAISENKLKQFDKKWQNVDTNRLFLNM